MIGTTVSHYQILEKLGEGGMGVVYKARDTRLDRLVALKFLPPERVADPERKRRFIREARAASALNHPNIITIHDIAEEGGADFIVMEYVSGRTLSQVIAGKPVPVKEAVGCAVQIADALIAAHRVGIIHRDLKPGNVMVTDDGRAKVLDFGLAKLTELAPAGEQSTLTLVAGTAAYMAPEQAEGQAADARSDIYSFGAVLYEMLAGRRAFSGFGREDPAPLSGVSSELQQIVARCLRRDPAERFQTAGELKVALERTGLEAYSTPSIAVLPFANLSADKENEYFSDGLTEELINALAQLEGLRVVSRTSVFRFKGATEDVRDIGRKLQVGAVLEGTVRRAGGRLRVTAQLVNVADGYHLWSQRFDREMQDIFDVQDELARAIVRVLRVRMAGKEEQRLVRRFTDIPEAYELCLKGRHLYYRYSRESLEKSIECYDQARVADPGCAAAYAGMAIARFCSTGAAWVPSRPAMPQAKAEAVRAVEIDDASAAAHLSLALVRHWYEWDWNGAEAEYKRALELDPGDADACIRYGEFCNYMGRPEEGVALVSRAVKLEPLSLETNVYLGMGLTTARRYEEAVLQFHKTLELDPNYYIALIWLGVACAAQGKYREAIEASERGQALTLGYPVPMGLLAWVNAVAGRTAEAKAILAALLKRRVEDYFSPFYLACIYTGLGEVDEAFRWLHTAFEERDCLLVLAKVGAWFDPLRGDPRFRELLRKMRLED